MDDIFANPKVAIAAIVCFTILMVVVFASMTITHASDTQLAIAQLACVK